MAIDIIARGLAMSLVGADGRIDASKLPTIGEVPDGAAFYPVGNLTDPSALVGKTADEILLMMLFGIVNPTFVKPSFSAKLTTATPIYAGRAQTITGTLSFNRGKINPAYTTNGYRAGAPTSYQVGDETIESQAVSQNFSIELTPTAGKNTLVCKVNYSAGEQPVNSAGEHYDAPYPAGTLTYNLAFNADYPLYSTEGALDFTNFTATDGNGYEIVAASEMASGVKQSFAVPVTLKVIGLKQYDVISKDWLWIGGDAETSLESFDTTVISGETLGETVDYTMYINTGVATGERQLRIYVEQK